MPEGEESRPPIIEPLTGMPDSVPLGSKATVVQFSSAFCQPCRATRRIVSQVVEEISATGVSVVEIDADEHLDVTRAWGITSTPTVIFLDSAGREVHRGSGQPRRADVIAGLGRAIA